MENDKSGIRISWTVLTVVVIPVIIAYGTGAWFMSSLTDSVRREADNQVEISRRITENTSSFDRRLNENSASFDHRLNVIEDKIGANKDQVQATTSSINDRLTRIEAQLAYLVKTTSSTTGR